MWRAGPGLPAARLGSCRHTNAEDSLKRCKRFANDAWVRFPFIPALHTDNRCGRRDRTRRERWRQSRSGGGSAGGCDPGQRDPARAVGGRVEERADLARQGGGRRPVADDVGERGPPAAAPDGPELPSPRPATSRGGRSGGPAGPRPPHPSRVGDAGPPQGRRRSGLPERTGTLVSPEGRRAAGRGP